ncbi:MAG: bifunctional phosphoribosyl-AMP cyclohydrolase/phosphoribosyl-ATP pyrophosphatase, partial [Lachnospiraceae bacterium]|nr:bifunctional phosphoribosyl-AMP cyclohydrolase/phosphoribosyl-ATP pyrophosphatase [Lachnospiraceae bacterium]
MNYIKMIAELNKENPVEAAIFYSNNGADEISYMDFNAAKEGREPDVELLKKITKVSEVPLIAGGGVKRLEDVKKMLYAGASMIYMKHAARLNVQFVKEMSERFGREKIGVAIDLSDADVTDFAVQCEEMGAGGIWLLGFESGMENTVKNIKEKLHIPVMISTENGDAVYLEEIIKASGADAILYDNAEKMDLMPV